MIIPPPSPCRTRKKISELSDQASPQSAELTPKMAMETIQTRFEPKRSVAQPAKGITTARERRYPDETHWIVLKGRVEIAGQRLEGDVYDRRVEDRHEHPDDHHRGDDLYLTPKPAVRRLARCRRLRHLSPDRRAEPNRRPYPRARHLARLDPTTAVGGSLPSDASRVFPT